MKPKDDEIIMTDHAIERILDRYDRNIKDPKKTILKLFEQAKEIRLHPTLAATRKMAHGMNENDRYYMHQDLIFVLSENIIITIMDGSGKKEKTGKKKKWDYYFVGK